MTARKIAAAVLLAASVVALAGCDAGKSADDDSLRPYIQVTPSGAEVVCTWTPWNGRTGNKWDCDVIHG